MKPGPLGIYYLEYAKQPFPRSARKLIIGYDRDQFLKAINEKEVGEDMQCWLEECRTDGKLSQGNIETIKEWITNHMPEKFGEPLK